MPVWSRDERELFYRVPECLMAARLSDGARLDVARRDTLFRYEYPSLLNAPAHYDVFPDGKSFAIIRSLAVNAAEEPVTVPLNWRPGVAGEARDP